MKFYLDKPPHVPHLAMRQTQRSSRLGSRTPLRRSAHNWESIFSTDISTKARIWIHTRRHVHCGLKHRMFVGEFLLDDCNKWVKMGVLTWRLRAHHPGKTALVACCFGRRSAGWCFQEHSGYSCPGACLSGAAPSPCGSLPLCRSLNILSSLQRILQISTAPPMIRAR